MSVAKRLSCFVVVVVLCAGSVGCSFVFVNGPSDAGTDCTTSQAPPVLDMGMGFSGASTIVDTLATVAATPPGAGPPPEVAILSLATGVTFATVGGVSANHGFKTVRRCYAHRSEQTAERIAARMIARSRPSSDEARQPSSDPSGDDAPSPADEAPNESPASTDSAEPTGEPSPDDEPSRGDEPASKEPSPECDPTNAPTCRSDDDCLSDQVCHPDKSRCLPSKCVNDSDE